AFERRVWPDFDRADATDPLRQLHVEVLAEACHPAVFFADHRVINVRVADKNVVLIAGQVPHAVSALAQAYGSRRFYIFDSEKVTAHGSRSYHRGAHRLPQHRILLSAE